MESLLEHKKGKVILCNMENYPFLNENAFILQQFFFYSI